MNMEILDKISDAINSEITQVRIYSYDHKSSLFAPNSTLYYIKKDKKGEPIVMVKHTAMIADAIIFKIGLDNYIKKTKKMLSKPAKRKTFKQYI